MNFLKINGAHGEGGGQIIRTAITLSCITNQPIHIENIRNNRKIPGLRPQHLTAIKILQKIINAKVVGAELESTEIKFIPGKIENIDVTDNVGTAGSVSLILQVLIPIGIILQKKICVTIKGGTDVSWSPSIEYSKRILREVYQRMGINFSLEIIKRGYYPKGGGEINLEIFPSEIKSNIFLERKTNDVNLVCSFSKIPVEKITNEVNLIVKKIEEEGFNVQVEIKNQDTLDSGASLLIYSIDENSTFGLDALFDKKLERFNIDVNKFTKNKFAIDNNLADMIVIPASLASGKTRFQVKDITKHLETNLFVVSKITDCKYGIGRLSNGYEVIIEGVSNSCIK